MAARVADAAHGPARGREIAVERCDSLRAAVERARATAEAGDTVLLAPACSSFDMFADYADRGRRFKDEVRRLATGRDGTELDEDPERGR